MKEIDIVAAERVGSSIFIFNFKHSMTRFPVSSGFMFMFYLNLFRLK